MDGLQVRELKLSEIAVGDAYQFDFFLEESMIDAFAGLTNDISPLHMDAKYAVSRGFKGRVCHGVFLSGLLSRLVGVHLPGKYALLQSTNIKYLHPAYAGKILEVQGVVDQVSEAVRCIIVKATIRDKVDATVLVRATIQVGVAQ